MAGEDPSGPEVAKKVFILTMIGAALYCGTVFIFIL